MLNIDVIVRLKEVHIFMFRRKINTNRFKNECDTGRKVNGAAAALTVLSKGP